MKRGQIIKALFYGGTEGPRRVIDDRGKIVVICHEDEYQAALREKREPHGVGFPRDSVVELDS